MKLAAAIGIPTAKVEARTLEGMDYLLVERYDRIYRADSAQGPVLSDCIRRISVKHWGSSRR